VGILGGMGPAAGADFVRLFVQACTALLAARGEPVRDQAFPPHWLAQLPVADRSAALADAHAPQPLDALANGLTELAGLGARAVAIACNTAHAWHGPLQAAVPQVRLLHAMDEVAAVLQARGIARVGLLATQGTYASGLYQQALGRRGIVCAVPQPRERQLVMDGIYLGVKRGEPMRASHAFSVVARELAARHDLGTVILGCTEIPLAWREPLPGLDAIDPAQVLAQRLAEVAYAG
jgi:aspartate racemase